MPNNNLERGLDYYKSRYEDFSESELRELREWTQTKNPYIAKRLGGNIDAELNKFRQPTDLQKYKSQKKKKVTETVQVEDEEGNVHTYERDARQALNDVNDQIEKYNQLLECLS